MLVGLAFFVIVGYYKYFSVTTQSTFACSKSTIETLEKSVKYVQS